MKLASVAKNVEDGIEGTLTYMDFPTQHWSRIRTNNTIERLNCEIKYRTRAIGAFSDGQSALMLVCARLRHVAGAQWDAKRYMNMNHLAELDIQNEADNIAGYLTAKLNLRKKLDTITLGCYLYFMCAIIYHKEKLQNDDFRLFRRFF